MSRPRRRPPAAGSPPAMDEETLLYARKRARQRSQRQRQERRTFDPSPPTDDDWTVPDTDTDGLRKVAPPAPLGEALEAFVRRQGWRERLRGSDALSNWERIVGADLVSRCEPVRVAGGTLVVRAESQVWATQLRYLVPQLQANVNAALGPGTVREVRIIVGPLGTEDPESRGKP